MEVKIGGVQVDDFTCHVVRLAVHAMHKQQVHVSVASLHSYLTETHHEELGFSRTILRLVLRKTGFVYKKRNNRQEVYEKRNLLNRRLRFVAKIREYRAAGYEIVYVDETWAFDCMAPTHAWLDTFVEKHPDVALTPHSQFTFGPPTSKDKGKRIIVVGAISKEKVVHSKVFASRAKACELAMDYHRDMDADEFLLFMREMVPRLRDRTIIVLDNASYHRKLIDAPPDSSSRKGDMIAFLERIGVPRETYDTSMNKIPFYKAYVQQRREEHKRFAIEELIEELAPGRGIKVCSPSRKFTCRCSSPRRITAN